MSKEKQIEEMAREICSEYDCVIPCQSCAYYGYENCRDVKSAEKLYNAGYRKQKIGKWHYPPYAPFGGSYEMKRCSVCGYKPDIDSENPYTKFCPDCGAKMKGGAE